MKVFAAGACRHVYVATLSYVQSAASQRVYTCSSNYSNSVWQNIRDLGPENCIRSVHLASKMNKIFLGENTPGPSYRYYMQMYTWSTPF